MRFSSLLATSLLFVSVLGARASAQDAASEAQARSRSAQAIACAERVHRDLGRQVQLLREARAQLDSSHADARRDAAHMVESLEQRIDDLGEALRACVPRRARLEPVVQVQEHTGTEAAVGQENAHTQRVEGDVALSRYVHVEVGERVDGHGQLAAGEVRSMMRQIGSSLERCYDGLAERSHLERGTLVLAFTVDSRGRVQRVRVEAQQIGDSTFNRCIRHAGQRMRARSTPRGGDVRFAYTLRFGPATHAQ